MFIKISERVMNMALTEVVKAEQLTYAINDSMNILLGKLDEAIDDMENGRVQIIDEVWEEIDRVMKEEEYEEHI